MENGKGHMDIPKFETPEFRLCNISMPLEIWKSVVDIPPSMNSMQKVALSAVIAGTGRDNLEAKLTALSPLFAGKERSARTLIASYYTHNWQAPERRPDTRKLIRAGAATLVLLKGIGCMAASRGLPPEVLGAAEGTVAFDIPEDKQPKCADILNEVTHQLSVSWDMTDETGLGNYVTVTTGTKGEPNRRWLTSQAMNGSDGKYCLALSGIRPVSEQHGVGFFPKSVRQMGKVLLVAAGREIASTS